MIDRKNWKKFAAIYNDTEQYPRVWDVARHLNMGERTARRLAMTIKRLFEEGEDVPELIDRSAGPTRKAVKVVAKTPHDHAHARAKRLSKEITALVTGTRYPLINPEAIVIDSYLSRRYSRNTGTHSLVEGTPRTWLSDTLRVAPVPEARARRFIFTGAQNDAEVHEEFWTNLQAYAEYRQAEIVIGPWTYETQWWAENNPTARSYSSEISDYLCFGQMQIGTDFMFCGEMNTLPTATRPISDLMSYSRGRWAVYPHATLQLKSVPSTDGARQAHQIMTTGAVTRPKVIPRKAGVRSIFNHVIGATIVEFDEEGLIFCRQLIAGDDGSFYDLDLLVEQGKVTSGHRARAANIGDIHVRKADPVNIEATFGKNGFLERIDPEMIFIHDVHDNEARPHHNFGDNAYSYEMAVRGKDDVLGEIIETGQFLERIQRLDCECYVVESNHDLGLERYVREGRYRNDGVNIRLGLQLEEAYLAWREEAGKAKDAGLKVEPFSILEHAVRHVAGSKLPYVTWIHDNGSKVVDDIECGHHGFRGSNGAQGSVTTFARMGRKMTIGHMHSPEILDGIYVAGAMALDHGYNKGPSSWCISHVVQYPNGKRALVTFQNGRYCYD